MEFFSNLFRKKQSASNNISNNPKTNPKLKKGEILPASEMKRKYNLTVENYQPLPLNANNIPGQFRDLVPVAQKWGIGDDIIREDLHVKASTEENQSLKSTLDKRTKAINQWLNSFDKGNMTEEAAAFMYMLEGLDEMNIQIDPGPDFHD